MNACDIIFKTKRRERLDEKEIKWLIDGYVNGSIPDYQMSAWLMAVCFASLSEEETVILTRIMKDSGAVLDLKGIKGVTVDKHSTGGIGDKTSLIAAPVCAACGIYVPKMSGRGLGFTGGTIDKLESIPGFQVNVDFDRYIDIINKNGAAIIAQSGNLVPADKKLYGLRDVTATVDSIPLICSSIMSKKLATGADCILLDVKTGSGAFMKNIAEAHNLAELMVKTGKAYGKKCRAMITDMNEPLGNAVGNAVEVIEVCRILSGKEKGRLYELSLEIAANMLELGGKGNIDECRRLAENAIDSGCAMEKFQRMIEAQGGNPHVTEDYSLFGKPLYKHEIKAEKNGYICEINSEGVGMTSLIIGAGRYSKDAEIDSLAGVILNRHRGDYVYHGDVIMTLYSSTVSDFSEASEKASASVEISETMPKMRKTVIEII